MNVEQLELSYSGGGENINFKYILENILVLKNFKENLLYGPAMPLLGIHSKERITYAP